MDLNQIYSDFALQAKAFGIDEIVGGRGNPHADVFLVGEAPGKQEMEQKKPFVGKAGKNLDEFLALSGIDIDTLYISNVVKFRPYKISAKGTLSNRPPTKKEIELCLPCLMREIECVRPKIIVTLGNTALHAFLPHANIGQVHGTLNGNVFALYHPASIIYNRSLKQTYEDDILKLSKIV